MSNAVCGVTQEEVLSLVLEILALQPRGIDPPRKALPGGFQAGGKEECQPPPQGDRWLRP